MEILDILNPDGTNAGYTAKKSEAHKQGLWHAASHAWIIDNNKNVFIQRRSKSKENHPDFYDISIGGHISAGETHLEAMVRETREEAGLMFDEEEFQYIGKRTLSYTENNGTYINHEWIYLYVLCTDKDVSEFTPQPSEVDHFIKLPLRELAEWISTEKEDCICDPKSFEMLNNYLSNK